MLVQYENDKIIEVPHEKIGELQVNNLCENHEHKYLIVPWIGTSLNATEA